MGTLVRGLGVLGVVACIAACGGDDGAAPMRDAGGGGVDSGPPRTCTTAADCDDSTFCNGAEACVEMRCVAGAPLDCADDEECTTDRCDEDTRACTHEATDADGDGHTIASCGGDDCDDADAMRFPGNTERCDGSHDEDCDPTTLGTLDDDADGVLSAACCNDGACGTDCNDSAGGVHPMAPEVCNRIDDDCDGEIDDGLPISDWYPDCDGDRYGAMAIGAITDCARPTDAPACTMPLAGAGWVADVNTDCNDETPRANPGATEVCDELDNDCNGMINDGRGAETLWYRDIDGDGYGVTGTTMRSCERPDGYAMDGEDCDDGDETINPGTPDICNGIDDDCDRTMIDEDGAALCSLAHAMSGCAAGACTVEDCDAGYDDCNGTASDGCEIDLTSTATDCGFCSNPCPTGPRSVPICTMSTCGIDCDSPYLDCNATTADGCEADPRSDIRNCGRCGNICPRRTNAATVCSAASCMAPCLPDYDDCDGDYANGCELLVRNDVNNCGGCGVTCLSNEACAHGVCVAPFPSDGSDGILDPDPVTMPVVTLAPGIYQYSRIRIRPGVTVTTTGSGILDLRSSGPIEISGTIDLSGSRGGMNIGGGGMGLNGGGGATGNPLAPGSDAARDVCAVGGGGGRGAPGDPSTVPEGRTDGCNACAPIPGGNRGGGAGGSLCNGGGGGGGFAGGGGAGGTGSCGGAGGSSGGSMGGGAACSYASGAGGIAPAPYGGATGSPRSLTCTGGVCGGASGGGGGGGSIGAVAAADLLVTDATFLPGSGGGGGAGGCACSACFTTFANYETGTGGGGGGGALRLASVISITIDGAVRADGGPGGPIRGNSIGGGGGGGGSGGVIWLSAPVLTIRGTVSAAGGAGGRTVDGHTCHASGGNGGLGRIRLSVDPAECVVEGSWVPVVDPACTGSVLPGTAGRAYIGEFPD